MAGLSFGAGRSGKCDSRFPNGEYMKDAKLTGSYHFYDYATDTHNFEFVFADGTKLRDKILVGATRAIVANHLQQLADLMRSLDADEPIPEEDG